jgi:hypothetical protein
VDDYESDEFLDCTLSALDYCDVYGEFSNLIKHGCNPSKLFNSVFEYHALTKIGHVDDKVFEMFSELTSYCFSENMIKDREITLYRGVSDAAFVSTGISWTSNENIAKWFANRFARDGTQPVVAKIVINSNSCLGAAPYENPEFEVVIHPDYIPEDIEIYKLIDQINVDMTSYIKAKKFEMLSKSEQ